MYIEKCKIATVYKSQKKKQMRNKHMQHSENMKFSKIMVQLYDIQMIKQVVCFKF
jgi:hypothetical protein